MHTTNLVKTAVSMLLSLLLASTAVAQSSVEPVSAMVNGPNIDVVFSASVLCPFGCHGGFSVRDAGSGDLLGIQGSPSPQSGTTTIRLVLGAAVSPGQVLTLTYAPGALTDGAGNPLAAFANLAISNATVVSTVAPVSATVNGPNIDVVFSASVLCPFGCHGGFSVRDAGSGDLLGIQGSPSPQSGTTTIRLVLGTAVSPGQVLTLTYAPGALTDGAGNPLAAFANLSISNATVVSTVAPVSATVNGPNIDVVFSASVLCPFGCHGGFSVRDAGSGDLLGIQGSPSPQSGTTTIRLVLGTAVSPGQVLTLTYAPGALTDGAGNPLATFANLAVNNETGTSSVFPVSATVNGPNIDVVFSASVLCPFGCHGGFSVRDAGSGDLLGIQGSPSPQSGTTTIRLVLGAAVSPGQVVTLTYAPGALTDGAGNPLATFANLAMNNETGTSSVFPISATVNGPNIDVVFSASVLCPFGCHGGFSVRDAGSGDLLGIQGSPSPQSGTTTIRLVLGTAVSPGQVLTLTYAPGALTDGAGNPLAAFANLAVSNLTVGSAADVTPQIQITRGRLRFIRATGSYEQIVTLKNVGSSAVLTPLSLVFDGLTSGTSLLGTDGQTLCTVPSGSPYINVQPGSDAVLARKEQVKLRVEFIGSSNQLSYTNRVLSGNGCR